MKLKVNLLVILCVFQLSIFLQSCDRNNDNTATSTTAKTFTTKDDVPRRLSENDPGHVVEIVLRSMATGKIEDSKIIYSEEHSKGILLVPSGDVKFIINDIRISAYNPNTNTVEYSCIVPHPAVAYWQWNHVDPTDLEYIPKGIPIHGKFLLVNDKDIGWRVMVNDEPNPILLYKGVAISINLTRDLFRKSGRSDQIIQFSILNLIATYSKYLNHPESEKTKFAKDVINEWGKVIPRSK